MRNPALAEARDQYETALRLQPRSPVLHAHLGRVLKRQGEPAEALEHYDAALELQPDLAEAQNNKGVALEALGRLPEALACYRRAVALDPEQLLCRCNLAAALHETGESEAARAEYRETLRRNPTWPRLALQEAWSLATDPEARKRNGAQALRTAKLACQVSEYRIPPALDVLAAAHAEAGQFEEAAAWERKALALAAPDAPAAAIKAFQERLRLYEGGQPFRQPPATAPRN